MKPIDKLLNIYADNIRPLLALAASITGDAAEAEDVLQDVLLKLLSQQDSLQDVRMHLPFLRSCVRNEAIDHLRRRRRELPTSAEVLDSFRASASQEGIAQAEELMWIDSFLEELGPEMRRAFIEYAVDGYTIADISRRMGIRQDTLRKRFDVIKKRMRRDMDPGSLMIIFMTLSYFALLVRHNV